MWARHRSDRECRRQTQARVCEVWESSNGEGVFDVWCRVSKRIVRQFVSHRDLSTVVTARQRCPDKRTLLVRKEDHVLIPCGIPYIFGTVGSPEKNLIPDAVLERNKIDLKTRAVRTAGGETIGYDRLILATGSLPITPPILGCDRKNVLSVLKEVPHFQKRDEMSGPGAGRAGTAIARRTRPCVPRPGCRRLRLGSRPCCCA